jgi:hypothetical protein
MHTPPLITLEDLREALAEAEASLARCDYIENWQRVLQCRQDWQQTIASLKAGIARREAEGEGRLTHEPTLPQAPWRGRLWKPGRGDDD